ncbi:serine-rich adhesin for platelets-like [Sabethes cyaneus]|uniref:serine-rich adhesin for platelets-like n=1 Tax=Sabethes cyaneus TaxID=53552 RepID=UPI00237EB4F9|nr:serine-rich adhesin for platelets-like [Sabethes cyaneus]
MESGYAFAISKRRDSDMGRISKLEPSAPSDRSDITEEFKKDEMGKDDLRKSSFSAVEGSIYDDDSPLLTDFTTSSITYVSERIDSSSLELMAGDSFGDYLKASATVNVKSDGMKIEAQSPGSGISCVTTASETLDSSAHEIEKAQQTSGSIQHDIPTEYEKSISPSDNAASDFSTESATKYNLPYDTESDSHEVLSGLPKIRDERTKVEEIQDVKIIKPCKLMSMDPRHESASPQSDITEYTESVSYVESIIDSTNYENALKQKEKQLEQQKQDEKIDAQEKQLIVKSKEHHDEKIIKSTDEIVAEKKESTQVKKKPKTKATVTKISLQKQTPIEISKQSSKTVDIKSASKSVEYSSSTSRTTTVSRTYTSTRTHGYMQSTLSRDQKVLKPLNLADSTHSSPAKSSYRSASIGSQLAEKKTKSSRETSSGKPVRTATKLANQIDSAESSTVKKQQEHKSTVQGTKYSRTSTDRSDRTTRSSTSSFTSSTSRYRSRKSTEPFEKQEPTIKKADKEQANQATKTTVSTSKSTKERTNKSLIPVKVTSAKGSPRKEPPAKTTVDKSATKKISQPTEEKTTQIMIITTTKSVDTSVTDVQTTMSSKIGFVKTTPRVTKTTHKSGDLKQDDTYRCKSAMHYSYKDAVTFDHAEIPSSLPSSPSRLNKSSSNSTNVLTSEVFTRTIDSSKSIEVIYRQPSTSNELIRKINEYRYNDIDLTTDSSLSDSIALPSSSSEHENDVLGRRKRSGSPASPKAHTATSSAPPPTTATVSRKQGQVVSEQRYRKSDIWMRTGPPPEVLPDGDDGEIYQTLHADRRTVASLDGIVMENRISPILDFRASTPPRLKYKFDYDSSLFTEIPVIAITQECSDDEELDDVSKLNINDAHTDTEDLIMEQDTVRFRKGTKTGNAMIDAIKPTMNGSVTDVEDCTDSDDDDSEAKSAKEADIVLDRFLDQGYVDETTSAESKGGKPKLLTRSCSKATESNTLRVFTDVSNALTDCEDMSDDDDSLGKVSIPDCPEDILARDNENDAVAIHNVVRRRQDKHFHKQEPAKDSSSESDTADSNVRHRKCHRKVDERPKSEYENLMMSDDEMAGACASAQINRRSVLFDAEELVMESSDVEEDRTNVFPEINITFVANERNSPIEQPKKKRPSSLMVQAPNPDEALTDVENLDSSSESEDEKGTPVNRLIPIAVVRAGKSGGITDVEDFNDSDDCDELEPKREVGSEFLPSPVREIAILKQNASGEQRQNVMPLLTILTPDLEQALTDVEDMSDNEDGDEMYDSSKYAIENLPEAVHDDVYSSDSTRINSAKLDVKGVVGEPITDTEDLVFDRSASNSGTGSELRRRRKPKHGHGSSASGMCQSYKGKKFLDMKGAAAPVATTDTEDLYLSDDAKECESNRTKQRRATIQFAINTAANENDGKTDVEFLSGDELTNERTLHSPQLFHDGFSSIIKTREHNGPLANRIVDVTPVPMIRQISPSPDTHCNCNTDCEDIQGVSDIDDETYSRAQTATPMELTRQLQESGRSEIYDTSTRPKSELLDVKGAMAGDIQEIHTDVEFLDDDGANGVADQSVVTSTASFHFLHHIIISPLVGRRSCPQDLRTQLTREEYLNLVHSEASNLVDSILEQSVSIVSSSQLQANAAIDTQAQSESEQYAIRSDILSSNEADLVVKSPTIESMSGKSFDDNISNPDYDSSEAIQQLAQFTVAPTSGDAGDGAAPTVTDTRESVGDGIVDDAAQKERRAKKIDRHFARLSSDIEPEALLDKNREYDEAIAQIKDEVSMLQSEFSKMSWDESISATTGDFGSSTPDHDLQETDTQLRTEITLPKPTPRSQTNLIAEADASATTTSVTSTTTTSSAAAAASSLTTSALGAKTTEDYAASILETDLDKPASGDMSELSSSQEPMPVPKPRTSISSRTDTQTRSSIIESFDQPEDSIEQYPEPSQQRQESLASEDFSGIAQKDGDFETSDEDQSAAKFYIGEKSTDIITRSTADKRADFAFDNIGYEYSQESGHEGEPLVDDAFKTYRDQTRKEDEFTLKSLQEVESGTALDAEIKAEVIEVIEGVASERTLELELDRTIGSVRQPVVHSPIKPQVVTVVEGAKPLTQKPRDSSETLLEDSSSFHYTKRTIDELVIEKTLDEVKESLDAVQEELIESVIDGKLLKQSPSEFEFKVLPSARYIQDPIYETQQEEVTTTTTIVPQTVTTTTILSEPTSLSETKTPSFEQKISDTEDKALLKPGEPSSLSSDSSPAKLEVSARLRATTSHAKGSRWSATDVDSSGESHYQSFEHTDSSRPLSSDVDNLLQQYASSEYETAMDHSILPASTEFHSAVSTLNSYNVSSHDSMKSFDSESSGNLASGESEATETLVPSTMDIDFDSEDAALLHDDSEEDLREKLIEHEELSAVSSAIPVAMKRSQEMNFATDLSSDLLADSSDVFQFQEEAERVAQAQAEQLSSSIGTALDLVESMKAASLEDVKAESTEEAKLGTSMEDGSILSISLSSASNLETIMENLPDKMDSLPTHVEVGLDAITPTTSDTKEIIGDITLTSTVVKEGDINFLNTQATTEIMSAESAEDTSKKRGHKRTESTIPGKLLSEIAAEARDSLDSQEDSISQEVATKQSSSERDDMREESSDSDYDRYESEYARSFRAPLNQGQKKKKDIKADGFEMEMEHDRRNSFSPSSAVIETIVEDVHAEIEQGNEAQKMMDTKREELQEYQQSSAQCIPDIQVTEDIQQIDFDQEEVPSQSQKVDTTASEQKIQFAKQEEFKISEEQYQEMIEQKYKSKMADVAAKFDYEADDKDDSAGSDSFEMLEQPDISDEFVIVEEVAREAHECDTEGKSVSIKPVKKEKKHDEEVEKLLVKSAPAHTNAGSLYANMREDMMYDFEESPPTGSEEVDPNGVTMDLLNNGYPLEESKRWVEMQLAETQNFRYPLEDRLEDIKEEDTDFEVGSSRIGSIKDSFSSTPDYDLLAKRLASREHDDISMSSLQEFENLEHVISLENRKMQQGSQDSLSNGSFTRRFMSRGHGDDISLSSLKEFEGLESACLEAQRIEIKAKEEAALLSRSDESNKSDKSTGAKRSPPTNGTIIKTSSSVSTVTSGPEKSTIVEVKATSSEISKDSLSTTTTVTTVTTISHDSSIRHTLDEEDTSHMLTVSTDSLDRSRVQKQTVTKDRLPSAHSSSDSLEINNKNNADVMTSSLDSIEFSKAGAITTRSSQSDSIEHIAQQQVQRSDSTDSIEMQHGISSRASEVKRDSLDSLPYSIENKSGFSSPTKPVGSHRVTTTDVLAVAGSSSSQYTAQTGMTKDISVDSLAGQEAFLTSTESLETSSTATNATYQNETDSQMSSSVTSCGSITMVDTLDNVGDFEGFGLQENITFKSTTTASSSSYSGQHQQQQQQQQHISHVYRGSSSTATTTTMASATGEFSISEIELLSRQMYPGELTFDDAKESAKEKSQSKTAEKDD